ncbi:MAG: universal stress protein [SAR202 cluster bacterium]|jgi:nucleotide-binding universal stress UspA family protein|nr:hypothetical protein [Chloroflexota bacterium]MDP7232015.1 universal stress protein [Dehalococcoidia bacterium]MDP7613245.1 universal stress protein [Dehalococcoidia bacterium]MQG47142.1 universal stress protein [SAR202 cluster bacterium]
MINSSSKVAMGAQINPIDFTKIALKLNLHKILVPLDGSLNSELCLPYASMLSRWFDGEITLLHVLPANPIAEVERTGRVSYPDAQHDRGEVLARSYLEAIIDVIAPQGIQARWGISTGSESEMILSRLKSGAMGIITMAITSKSDIRKLFTPDILDQIYKKVSVPILVINGSNIQPKIQVPKQPNTLLIPMSKKLATTNINRIIALSIASKAKMLFIHKSNNSKFVTSEMTELLNVARSAYEIITFNKNIVSKTLDLQKKNDDSWIISTTSIRTGFNRLLFRGLSNQILESSSCPLLILPHSN